MQEFAAVHADDFAVDVGGAVAHQKRSEVGQLFDRAESMLRIAVEGEGFQFRARQDAGERALRGNGAGSNGVHADAAVAPLDGEAAGEGFDSGFGNSGRHDVGRANGRVRGGNAEDGTAVRGFEPAAAAGQGAVEGSHEHDADNGVPCAGRKVFGAGDEVSGGVVDEDVERELRSRWSRSWLRRRRDCERRRGWRGLCLRFLGEFGGGLLEDFFAAAADVDRGSEFEEALGHAFAEAGAAAGDQDALVLQKVGSEHLVLASAFLDDAG